MISTHPNPPPQHPNPPSQHPTHPLNTQPTLSTPKHPFWPGTVLREAHLDLEGITMDREVMRIRDTLSAEFSRLCYYGFWYAPEMELVMNSIDFSQKNVTGAVEMKLYKGMHLI